jgi:diguanylate cyclase (GGDEF)-like protein
MWVNAYCGGRTMNETPRTKWDGRAFVPRAYAALFGLGGLLVLGTMAISEAADRKPAFMSVPAATALVLAASLLWFAERIPERACWLLPQYGSLCVASVAYGAGTALRITYAMFFFWSITSAFYFFPRRIAWSNLPTAGALYLFVLLVTHEDDLVVRYVITMAVVTVIVTLIDQLNASRARLAVELDQTLSQLREQARTDPVTGLPNRREFARHLDREVARARRGGLAPAVLMIDLDHFKEFNDSQGHPAGDRLLQAVALIWARRLRTGDLLVRFGGDEFAAILPDCSIEDATHLADRLRTGLPDGETCSVGVAAWLPGESGAELIDRADEALLRAKRDGRNEIRLAAQGQAFERV